MEGKQNFADRLAKILVRFGQDLVGLILISLSLIGCFSLLGWTQGTIADFLSSTLAKGFGWGSYLLAIFISYLGIQILFRRIEQFPKLNLSRIIYLEISILSLMGLLNLFNGLSIDLATQGYAGGVVGWGIGYITASLLSFPLATILLSFTMLSGIISGAGLMKPISKWLDQYFSNIVSSTYPNRQSIKRNQEKITIKNDQTDNRKKTRDVSKETNLPDLSILLDPQPSPTDESYVHAKAMQIEKSLLEFGVPARVAGYRIGPTIIQYAVEPGYVEKVNNEGDVVRKKIRVAQIAALQKDLTLALSVDRLRIEAPIPGHSFVGIEIPNNTSSLVCLKSLVSTPDFHRGDIPLLLALGLDVSGNPVLVNLTKMPHLLIAGTTGSGKSVCMTSLISCLILNNSPDDLRIAILDPKMVELVRFNGLPHLLGKVETDLARMLGVLAWLVKEMEDRYRKMESIHARDLDDFNIKMFRRGKEKLPRIVLFVDELADLMLNASDQTEAYLVRLAQMARATGIHLVVATQRPSTDIITGLIKANFPARISFMTASSIDSRVVLDQNGAETLMGSGDLLFLNPEESGLQRAQSVLVDDREIENLITYWQNKSSNVEEERIAPWEDIVPIMNGDSDELVYKAADLVRSEGKASTSWLQRKLRIGFPRAARLMEELEDMGVVGPLEPGSREREILDFPGGENEVDNN